MGQMTAGDYLREIRQANRPSDQLRLMQAYAKKQQEIAVEKAFTKKELDVIKTDCFHILRNINLSEDSKQLRHSIIDKVEEILKELEK